MQNIFQKKKTQNKPKQKKNKKKYLFKKCHDEARFFVAESTAAADDVNEYCSGVV